MAEEKETKPEAEKEVSPKKPTGESAEYKRKKNAVGLL